jgi:hypothetical protein
LLHLKNDKRCPLCRANIESESSEEEDDEEDEDDSIEVPHLYRYEIHGTISVNYNLKILIYVFIVSIQYNIIMFLLFMNNK